MHDKSSQRLVKYITRKAIDIGTIIDMIASIERIVTSLIK